MYNVQDDDALAYLVVPISQFSHISHRAQLEAVQAVNNIAVTESQLYSITK